MWLQIQVIVMCVRQTLGYTFCYFRLMEGDRENPNSTPSRAVGWVAEAQAFCLGVTPV